MRGLTHHQRRLVKGVGASSPPGEEDGQADRLEQLGGDADADGVEGPLFAEDLGEELREVRCQSSNIL